MVSTISTVVDPIAFESFKQVQMVSTISTVVDSEQGNDTEAVQMVSTISTVVDKSYTPLLFVCLDGKHNFYCCRSLHGHILEKGLDGKHNFYCCRQNSPMFWKGVQMVSTISTVVDYLGYCVIVLSRW